MSIKATAGISRTKNRGKPQPIHRPAAVMRAMCGWNFSVQAMAMQPRTILGSRFTVTCSGNCPGCIVNPEPEPTGFCLLHAA